MPAARNGARRAVREQDRREQRALAAAGLKRSHHTTAKRAARSVRGLAPVRHSVVR